MVVQQNTSQVSPFIDCKGDVIQNVTEYKFLACLFKYNGNLRHSLEERRFTLFSVKACTKVNYEDIKESGANRVSCFTPLKISKYSECF
jgi:hypothetical protein